MASNKIGTVLTEKQHIGPGGEEWDDAELKEYRRELAEKARAEKK